MCVFRVFSYKTNPNYGVMPGDGIFYDFAANVREFITFINIKLKIKLKNEKEIENKESNKESNNESKEVPSEEINNNNDKDQENGKNENEDNNTKKDPWFFIIRNAKVEVGV